MAGTPGVLLPNVLPPQLGALTNVYRQRCASSSTSNHSKFSAGRRCTGAGCRFTSQVATRSWYQAAKGWCGHSFPPPGGSWYPIRVTWTRIGHQAISGLDEGVWNRTVGDLGTKG